MLKNGALCHIIKISLKHGYILSQNKISCQMDSGVNLAHLLHLNIVLRLAPSGI
jgi:hypothetical protein